MSAPVLAFVNPMRVQSNTPPFKDHPLLLVHLCWLQMFYPDVFNSRALAIADLTKRFYQIDAQWPEEDRRLDAAAVLRQMEAEAMRRARHRRPR